jgi:CRISPR-associated protein Cmr1
MPRLNVTLETITPLFLAGTEDRVPELRSPSIRGGLRFWLRALLGGELGNDLSSIRRAEADVFGSTDAASAVVIRVLTNSNQLRHSRYRPLLHNPQRKFAFDGWDPDQSFTVGISTRAGVPALPQSALASLLLLVSLGGLGRRSRRGFGSLQIQSCRFNEGLGFSDTARNLLSPDVNDGPDLVRYLQELVEWAPKTIVHSSSPQAWNGEPSFSILSASHTKVLVCSHPFATWEHAMRDFWGKLRSSPYRDDPVFGLPIRGRGERRASPLLLTIWRVGGRYYLVLTGFRAKLTPSRTGDWGLLARFLDECQRDWNGTYVLGGEASW